MSNAAIRWRTYCALWSWSRRRADGFDIVHFHTGFLQLPLARGSARRR